MCNNLREKTNHLYSKSGFQMFSLISGHHVCVPVIEAHQMWHFHTELYKFAWNIILDK